MTRFLTPLALSAVFVLALGGVFAVGSLLAMPQEIKPVARPAAATNFCEWEYAGPVTGWVKTASGCQTGEVCTPPGRRGLFIGDIELTDCVAAPAPAPVTAVPQRMPSAE